MKDPQDIRIKKTRQLIERSLRKRFDNESVDKLIPYIKFIQDEEVLDMILIDYVAKDALHEIQEKVILEILSNVNLSLLNVTDVERMSDPYFPNIERFSIEFEDSFQLKLVVRKTEKQDGMKAESKYGIYADGVNKNTSVHATEVARKAKDILIEKSPERRLQYLLLFDDLFVG